MGETVMEKCRTTLLLAGPHAKGHLTCLKTPLSLVRQNWALSPMSLWPSLSEETCWDPTQTHELRQDITGTYFFLFLFFKYFFGLWWLYWLYSTEMTGKRVRERGSDMQKRDPDLDSNPGPLQWGQSLCTWDARSTTWAKRCPHLFFKVPLTDP